MCIFVYSFNKYFLVPAVSIYFWKHEKSAANKIKEDLALVDGGAGRW